MYYFICVHLSTILPSINCILPFLCSSGAFLLPYFLITVFGALPLFFMELVLGQYNRQGPITVWKICPFFRGQSFVILPESSYVRLGRV